MSRPEMEFSKARLETLCDGIFAIAMTLLVLELKVPYLPRRAESAEIWHALREHALPFVGFALSFIPASTFWLLHHQMFQRLRHPNKALDLVSCLGSSLLHRGRRGARPARREAGACRAHVTDEQRRRAGCIAGRMQTNF